MHRASLSSILHQLDIQHGPSTENRNQPFSLPMTMVSRHLGCQKVLGAMSLDCNKLNICSTNINQYLILFFYITCMTLIDVAKNDNVYGMTQNDGALDDEIQRDDGRLLVLLMVF